MTTGIIFIALGAATVAYGIWLPHRLIQIREQALDRGGNPDQLGRFISSPAFRWSCPLAGALLMLAGLWLLVD